MSATNETPYYGLPQFIGSDKPTWQGDINGAFETIDGALHHLAENGGSEGGGSTEIVQTIGNSKTAVMSQNAVSRALATKLSATGIKTVNGESLIGEGNIEIDSETPVLPDFATINGQSITNGGNITTGTLNANDIATINGQSLTNGGNIDINSGDGNVPTEVCGTNNGAALVQAIQRVNSQGNNEFAIRTTLFNTQTNSNGGYSYTTIPTATSNYNGAMSAADKTKLDNMVNITSIGNNLTLSDSGELTASSGGGSSIVGIGLPNLVASTSVTYAYGTNAEYQTNIFKDMTTTYQPLSLYEDNDNYYLQIPITFGAANTTINDPQGNLLSRIYCTLNQWSELDPLTSLLNQNTIVNCFPLITERQRNNILNINPIITITIEGGSNPQLYIYGGTASGFTGTLQLTTVIQIPKNQTAWKNNNWPIQ